MWGSDPLKSKGECLKKNYIIGIIIKKLVLTLKLEFKKIDKIIK